MAEKRGVDQKLVIVLVFLLLIVFINASITGEAKYRLKWRGPVPTVQIQSSAQPAPATLIINPIGWHDSISSDCSSTSGWSCDSSDYSKSVFIQILDASQNNKLVGKGYASNPREAAVGNACGGNSNRGFSIGLDNSLKDGKSHSLYAYATNIPQGNQALLSGTPKTVTCPAPNPCTNSIKDGSETDVDCGGTSCPKCGHGRGCITHQDCLIPPSSATVYVSGACVGGTCMYCIDSDYGLKPNVAGSASIYNGTVTTYNDYCINSTHVKEYTCPSWSSVGSYDINCVVPSNTTSNATTTQCSAGRCV